jgi:hypothetical protein
MRWFLPVPGSRYHRFWEQIVASITRLKSIDEIEPYLASRVDVHARIPEGAVLTIDVVSCAKTFVGMRHVEEGQVAHLFVIYLQPLTPEAKCSPLFIIESEVGLANDVIRQKIDEVVEITRRRIRRVPLLQMATLLITTVIMSSWRSGNRYIRNGDWKGCWKS